MFLGFAREPPQINAHAYEEVKNVFFDVSMSSLIPKFDHVLLDHFLFVIQINLYVFVFLHHIISCVFGHVTSCATYRTNDNEVAYVCYNLIKLVVILT